MGEHPLIQFKGHGDGIAAWAFLKELGSRMDLNPVWIISVYVHGDWELGGNGSSISDSLE